MTSFSIINLAVVVAINVKRSSLCSNVGANFRAD